jgi:hypothetical protein
MALAVGRNILINSPFNQKIVGITTGIPEYKSTAVPTKPPCLVAVSRGDKYVNILTSTGPVSTVTKLRVDRGQMSVFAFGTLAASYQPVCTGVLSPAVKPPICETDG